MFVVRGHLSPSARAMRCGNAHALVAGSQSASASKFRFSAAGLSEACDAVRAIAAISSRVSDGAPATARKLSPT